MQKRELNCHTCKGRPDGIFCDLQGVGLDKLDKEKAANFYKRGRSLFLSGSPSSGLYCVHSGKVKITKIDAEGKETIVRIAGAGGVVGHRSLFSETPYKASATVLDEGIICFVSKKTILDLIKEEPKMAFKIINQVSLDMGAAEDRLASMARKSIRERFAETLLILKEGFGVSVEGKTKLDIRLTRDEIGAMVGAASENITRLVTEFKELGYIDMNGKTIILLDVKAIESEAALSY